MDKFDKHMAKPQTVTLVSESGEETTFTLYPLTYEHLPKVFRLLRKVVESTRGLKGIDLDTDLSKLGASELDALFRLFDEETIKLLGELALETLKISYPEQFQTEKSIERMKRFVASNLFELFLPIITLNTPAESDVRRMRELTKQIKNETDRQSKPFGAKRRQG